MWSNGRPDSVPDVFVCESVAQFIEKSTAKSAFLWYRSQRDVHLFYKFRVTFT